MQAYLASRSGTRKKRPRSAGLSAPPAASTRAKTEVSRLHLILPAGRLHLLTGAVRNQERLALAQQKRENALESRRQFAAKSCEKAAEVRGAWQLALPTNACMGLIAPCVARRLLLE